MLYYKVVESKKVPSILRLGLPHFSYVWHTLEAAELFKDIILEDPSISAIRPPLTILKIYSKETDPAWDPDIVDSTLGPHAKVLRTRTPGTQITVIE